MGIFILLGGIFSLFTANFLDSLLRFQDMSVSLSIADLLENREKLKLFFLIWGICCLLIVGSVLLQSGFNYRNKLVKIAPKIRTPAASGNHEMGSAVWMTNAEKKSCFTTVAIPRYHPVIQELIATGRDDLKGKPIVPIQGNTEILKVGGAVVGKHK